MNMFQSIQLSIPLWQVILLGIISLLCLLSSRLKLGLISTFVFIFYWGLVNNFSEHSTSTIHFETFDVFYLVFGISLSVIFLLCFIIIPDD